MKQSAVVSCSSASLCSQPLTEWKLVLNLTVFNLVGLLCLQWESFTERSFHMALLLTNRLFKTAKNFAHLYFSTWSIYDKEYTRLHYWLQSGDPNHRVKLLSSKTMTAHLSLDSMCGEFEPIPPSM